MTNQNQTRTGSETMCTPLANTAGVQSTTIAIRMARSVFDDLLGNHFSEGMRTRIAMVNDHEVFEAAQRLRDLLDKAVSKS